MKGNWVITGIQPALFLQSIIILRQGQGGGVLSNAARGLGAKRLQSELDVSLAPEADQKYAIGITTIIRNDHEQIKHL